MENQCRGYEEMCSITIALVRHKITRDSVASNPESDLKIAIMYATTSRALRSDGVSLKRDARNENAVFHACTASNNA